MSSFGNYSTIFDILDIDYSDENKSRISHFLVLSDTWLDNFAPSDVLDDLDTDTKNMATNLHCSYLFSLSAGRFSEETPKVALEMKDEGVRLLERAINNDMKSFLIRKVNK